MSTQEFTFWLYARKTYAHPYGAVRLTKSKGQIRKGEVALSVRMEIPKALFFDPVLKATIKVPENGGPEIEATVISDAEQILSKRLGMDIRLTLEGQKA